MPAKNNRTGRRDTIEKIADGLLVAKVQHLHEHKVIATRLLERWAGRKPKKDPTLEMETATFLARYKNCRT